MGNVVELILFRNEKQFIKHYLENYELEWDTIMGTSTKSHKKETDREMQLAYMRLLTKKIETNSQD